MTPRRLQMRRTRGWRKPEGAVYVGRPSAWGNPFVNVGRDVTTYGGGLTVPPIRIVGRGDCVDVFRLFVDGKLPEIRGVTVLTDRALDMRRNLDELRDRDLLCWCRPSVPCHADILIELANARRA